MSISCSSRGPIGGCTIYSSSRIDLNANRRRSLPKRKFWKESSEPVANDNRSCSTRGVGRPRQDGLFNDRVRGGAVGDRKERVFYADAEERKSSLSGFEPAAARRLRCPGR